MLLSQSTAKSMLTDNHLWPLALTVSNALLQGKLQANLAASGLSAHVRSLFASLPLSYSPL
jgi:hypothetical protein